MHAFRIQNDRWRQMGYVSLPTTHLVVPAARNRKERRDETRGHQEDTEVSAPVITPVAAGRADEEHGVHS